MATTNSLIYPKFYQPYITALQNPDRAVVEQLSSSLAKAKDFFQAIPKEKQEYRYAPDKWTVKDVVRHLTDTELIFLYRALRFARKDSTELHGFNENVYAQNAGASHSSFDELTAGLYAIRESAMCFFNSFDESQMKRKGMVAGNLFSVAALGCITAGHLLHHIDVIEKRYL